MSSEAPPEPTGPDLAPRRTPAQGTPLAARDDPDERRRARDTKERDRRQLRATARMLLEVARSLLGPALAALVVLVAAWAYDLAHAAWLAPLVLLLGPAIAGGTRAVGLGLFRDDGERLVTCDDGTARRLRRLVSLGGLATGVLLPSGLALDVLGYPPGASEAVYLALQLTVLALLVYAALRGGALRLAAAPPESEGARARARLARGLWRFLALYVLAVAAIWGVGYHALARYLAKSTALTAMLLGAAFTARRFLHLRLDEWASKAPPAVAEGAEESTVPAADVAAERAVRAAIAGPARALVTVGLAVLAALLLLLAWGADLPQAVELLSRRALISWREGDATLGITLWDVVVGAATVIVAVGLGAVGRYGLRRRLVSDADMDRGTRDAIANAVAVLVVGAGLYLALARFHVSLEALKWLGGAIGLGVGFGLQNIVNNFVSGIILLVEKPVRTDDIVDLGGIVGRVDEIGTRSTRLVDADNLTHIVPNSELIQKRVVNWTINDPSRRILVTVNVAHASDIQLVRRILTDCADAHGLVLRRPPPEVFFEEFGLQALQFSLAVHVGDAGRAARVRSDLRFAIEAAFRKNEIQAPFPQHIVRLAQGDGDGAPRVGAGQGATAAGLGAGAGRENQESAGSAQGRESRG